MSGPNRRFGNACFLLFHNSFDTRDLAAKTLSMAFAYWRRVIGACEIVDLFKCFFLTYLATPVVLQFVEINFNQVSIPDRIRGKADSDSIADGA